MKISRLFGSNGLTGLLSLISKLLKDLFLKYFEAHIMID